MNRKGFTLIELLIVVVIIGILAAIAIPKFANTKEKAYLASMKSDLLNLVTAEEADFADSLKYSGTIGGRGDDDGGDQRRAGSGVLDGDGLGGARGRHLHRVWAPPRHTPRAATTRAPHVGGGRRCGRRSQRARAGCRDPGFRHAGGALE